jgi:hypothetical protein
MIRFLFGVIVGIVLSFLLVYCGGGKMVKTVGEGLTETGKRMEKLEGELKKEKEDLWKGVKKKFSGEEKEGQKGRQ